MSSDATEGQPPVRPLLNRLSTEWREWFGGNADAPAAHGPAVEDNTNAPKASPATWTHGPHGAKLMSAADAAALVRSGDHVFVGTACATPRALVAALEPLLDSHDLMLTITETSVVRREIL